MSKSDSNIESWCHKDALLDTPVQVVLFRGFILSKIKGSPVTNTIQPCGLVVRYTQTLWQPTYNNTY